MALINGEDESRMSEIVIMVIPWWKLKWKELMSGNEEMSFVRRNSEK
jgi:hypothetical protein